jgi:hypothetical protein
MTLPARRSLLPLLLLVAAVPCPAASYFYAVGSNNHLYEVSDTGVRRDLRDLSGLGGAGLVNGAAFDAARSQFFFAVPGASSSAAGSLWYWNQATNDTPVSLGLLPTARPDNGAYWDGAYWYIQQGTHTLHRIALQYDGSGAPSLSSGGASSATLTGGVPVASDNYFGDIVITSGGILYATTANGDSFYSLSLSSGPLSGSKTVTSLGTVGSAGVDKLQLSFDSSGSTLYGHAYDTGQWYTVNTTNGALTTLAFSTLTGGVSNGFQDIAGASALPTPSAGVPDRGPWLALLSVTLVSLVLARRRR